MRTNTKPISKQTKERETYRTYREVANLEATKLTLHLTGLNYESLGAEQTEKKMMRMTTT
jgi:hypothetical protein